MALDAHNDAEVRQLQAKFKALSDNAKKKAMPRMNLAVANIHSKIVQSIQGGSRSGREYKRGSITHQASAGGEPPKSDTGNLAGKIFFGKATLEGNTFTGEIVARAKYAKMLEEGTRHIEPRPYMHPAFMDSKDDIKKQMILGMRDAIKASKSA